MPKGKHVLFQVGVVAIRVLAFRIHMQRWGLPRRHARLLHSCSAAGACPGAMHIHMVSHILRMHMHCQRWGLPRRHAHLLHSCSAAGACPGAMLMLHKHTCIDCLSFLAALEHEAVRLVAAPAWPAPPLWRGGRCAPALARARCLA